MKKARKVLALTLTIVMVLVCAVGCGSDNETAGFPTKTITIICNYGAGGGTDLECRALASTLEGILGVPVSVVDKEGGSGTVGITELKNSKADGYTIGVTSYSPMVIVPNTVDVSYTIDDFRYLGNLTSSEYCLVAQKNAPFDTFDEYVEYSIKQGGTTAFGSGYPHPLFASGVNAEYPDANVQFVNQASSAEVVTAVIGGHCDIATIVAGDVVNYVKSDEIKVIANLGEKRSIPFPDVETLMEQNHDINLYTYMGFGMPAGVPDEEYQILCDAFRKAAEDPDFQEQIANINLVLDYFPGDEYYEILKNDTPAWQEYFANNK